MTEFDKVYLMRKVREGMSNEAVINLMATIATNASGEGSELDRLAYMVKEAFTYGAVFGMNIYDETASMREEAKKKPQARRAKASGSKAI